MRHRSSLALPGLPRRAPKSLFCAPKGEQVLRTQRGSRVLVVQLSSFRLERCGWRWDEPVVLLAEERSALRIQAATLAARRLGMMRGMSISEARALVPDIRVELLADLEEEKQDLQALAHLLQCLGPEAHPLGDQAIAVQVDGSAPRLGGEPGVLHKARGLLHDLGHHARLIVADTRQVALALARCLDRDHIVPPGESAAALAQLPLSALAPSTDLKQVLATVGVHSFGDLAALPAASVATRFGLEGVQFWRIAQGRAVDARPPPALTHSSILVFRRQLPDPIDQVQGVLFALNELTTRLQAALSALDQAAVRMQIRLGLEQGEDHLLPLRMGQPRRAARDLMLLIRRRTEGLTLRSSVTDVALEVLESCPFVGVQQGLLDAQGAQEPIAEILARLSDTLGDDAVFSPRLVDSHRPEYGWSAEAWRPSRRKKEPPVVNSVQVLRSDRPTLLLRDPLPIRCELSKHGALLRVQVQAHWCPVRLQAPPEELQGGWWTAVPFDRDYRRVLLADGRQAWVFAEQGSWWLQGWWD